MKLIRQISEKPSAVKWLDACTFLGGDIEAASLVIQISVGWPLFGLDDKKPIVAVFHSVCNGGLRDVTTIPAEQILEIEILESEKKLRGKRLQRALEVEDA